jgi:hypothetical protein
MCQAVATKGGVKSDNRLYTLEVFILGGPMTLAFVERNEVVSRTIQIRSDQTLEDLHHAIFAAFDRFEQHFYEFQVGGKGPKDSKGRRYVTSNEFERMLPEDPRTVGDVARSTIGSIGLNNGDVFGYLFDFGEDWWHQVNVVEIKEKAGRGKYPKVTKCVGESPPQYVDWDEEDDD